MTDKKKLANSLLLKQIKTNLVSQELLIVETALKDLRPLQGTLFDSYKFRIFYIWN